MQPNLINPNYHVILIHYPLALFVLGTLIELFAFLWRKSTIRTAGRWMILIGALSMLPATTSGMFALSEAEKTSDAQWELLTDHVIQGASATGVAILAVVLWIACSDRNRRRLHWPLMLLLLLANALAISGAWHAGEAVYQHGTGVAHVDSDTAAPPATQPSVPQAIAQRGLSYVIEPLDGHLILAGLTVAFACVSIGLAYRQVSRARQEETADKTDDTVVTAGPGPARFWMLAVLCGLATASFGYWYLADSIDAWSDAKAAVGPDATLVTTAGRFARDLFAVAINEYPRRAIHTINGIVLVLLMLFLAFLGWQAPKRVGWLSAVVVLLLVSLAIQGWLGTLLLYEGPDGPVTNWVE